MRPPDGAPCHQTSPLQHHDVLGDGVQAGGEPFGNLGHPRRAILRQQRKNRPAGRVARRFQHITKRVFLFNHMGELRHWEDSFN